MTREEERKKAAEEYSAYIDSTGEERYNSTEFEAFIAGAEYADKHTKSPWIDVRENLPCNHINLRSTEYATVNVFARRKGGSVGLDCMVSRNGKWEWDSWREEYTHWMEIPSVK